MNSQVLIIVGPTASGKSNVAIELALRVNGEIISADSMQVYRQMDIGTAKLSHDEMQGIRHFLIDIINPEQPFSVAEYQRLARTTILDIEDRGHIPIIVGGTGLYIRAAIDQLEFPATDENKEIRIRLEERLQEMGPQALYDELILRDPAAADIILPSNNRRIIRALEVIEITGKPFSSFHTKWKAYKAIFNTRIFGLSLPRDVLYARINSRVDIMIESGLIDEVKVLVEQGYENFLTSQQAIGYKELIGYIYGKCTLEEAVDVIKKRTRNYAKRQLTWFRADPRIAWIDTNNLSAKEIASLIIDRLRLDGFIEHEVNSWM